jgi:poly(3-hydroxybutyrate) depolymerase
MKLLSLIFTSISTTSLVSALTSNSEGSPQDISDVICTGRPRTTCAVELDVPHGCEEINSNCPIVFFLHGSGGTNRWFKNTSGVHSAGYIGIYPNGEGGWSTGPKSSDTCQWDDFQCTTDPDEGDFIASIIQEVKDRGANGNIYAIGNSNGAALAHRLASNADSSLPIKGIVAKVTQLLKSPERSGPGTFNYNQPSSVRGTHKVSVLSIMGTEDGLIPYEGGSSSVFGGNDNFQLMSAMESMNTWAIHNGCSGEYEMSQHVSDQGDLTATKYTYGSCPSDIIVEH